MKFADVAEEVLRRASGGPLHYKEITDRALAEGLFNPRSQEPWIYMAAAINADNRKRQAKGDRPRFATGPRRGYFRLKAPSSRPEEEVRAFNEKSKKLLLKRLAEMDPFKFEELIGQLLTNMGFDDIEVTKRSGDGGIDVRGLFSVGGVTFISTAVQVKRWQKNVPPAVVRDIRGGIAAGEQGMIVTLSDFTKEAVTAAEDPRLQPVALINGRQLVDLLAAWEIGFKKQALELFEVDESAFLEEDSNSRSDETNELGTDGEDLEEHAETLEKPHARRPGRPKGGAPTPRALFKLQGGPRKYLSALVSMLEHAATQPTVEEFLDWYKSQFPEITVRTMARRHIGVMFALGFVQVDADRIALTPEGNNFLTTKDPSLVRKAIIERIPGAAEIEPLLTTLKGSDRICEAVQSAGVQITPTQVTLISGWLRQTL